MTKHAQQRKRCTAKRTYESTQYLISELVYGRKGFNWKKKIGRATMERHCEKNMVANQHDI